MNIRERLSGVLRKKEQPKTQQLQTEPPDLREAEGNQPREQKWKSPQQVVQEERQLVEELSKLPIREAEKRIGVKGYTPIKDYIKRRRHHRSSRPL